MRLLVASLFAALVGLAGSAHSAVIYDEAASGDLSASTHQQLSLSAGDNVILGSVCFDTETCASEGDFDLFDFFFAANQQLSAITIEYLGDGAAPGSPAALAAETANSSISYLLVSPPGALNVNGPYLGLQQIGVDSEPSNSPYSLFSGILPRGDGIAGYTLGNFQMTSNGSEGFALDYRITLTVGPGGDNPARIATDQVVPEAPTLLLLLAGLPLLAAARRRRI